MPLRSASSLQSTTPEQPIVSGPAFVAAFVPEPDTRSARTRRWSVDGWVLWREEMGRSAAAGQSSYGRSQAGAVARYQLRTDSVHRPQAYVRASAALNGAREREVATGVSARPLGRVPVRLAAELRATDTTQGTQLRGSAYAVSELAPIALPAELTAEVYVQAGYVTGDFATAFVDGQARVTRELASTGGTQLSVGGGAWGGAQDGAERFDVGPSAALGFRIGESYGRLSADYRVRVAGDAAPSSGPALTLSAGF